MKGMTSRLIMLLMVMVFSLNLLRASEDLPVEVNLSSQPCDLTDEEVAKVDPSPANNVVYKGDFLTAHLKNTGTSDLPGLTIKFYAILEPDPSDQDADGKKSDVGSETINYTLGKVFTSDTMTLTAGNGANFDLGKVALKTILADTKFGAQEKGMIYAGFVAEFYQDGKLIGKKSSNPSPAFLQAAVEQNTNIVTIQVGG